MVLLKQDVVVSVSARERRKCSRHESSSIDLILNKQMLSEVSSCLSNLKELHNAPRIAHSLGYASSMAFDHKAQGRWG